MSNLKQNTVEFINTSSDATYDMIPSLFLDRAEADLDYIYLKGSDIAQGLAYLQFEDLNINADDQVTGKIRISGRMANGKLLPMAKDAQNQNGSWLRGFKSETLIFDETLVKAGSLTADELLVMREHAEFWQANQTEMYGEYVKKRLWLSANTDNAVFIFNLEGRPNPSTPGEVVPGLVGCAWKGMKVIGSGFSRTGNFGNFDFVVPSATTGAPVSKTTIIRR